MGTVRVHSVGRRLGLSRLRFAPDVRALWWYTAEELVSRPFLDFVHPEDVERTKRTIDVLGSEEIHQFENRYICRDGSVRWLQWNTRPGPTKALGAVITPFGVEDSSRCAIRLLR